MLAHLLLVMNPIAVNPIAVNSASNHESNQGAARHLPVARGRERNATARRNEPGKSERPSEPRLQAAVARKGGENEPYDANVPCTD